MKIRLLLAGILVHLGLFGGNDKVGAWDRALKALTDDDLLNPALLVQVLHNAEVGELPAQDAIDWDSLIKADSVLNGHQVARFLRSEPATIFDRTFDRFEGGLIPEVFHLGDVVVYECTPGTFKLFDCVARKPSLLTELKGCQVFTKLGGVLCGYDGRSLRLRKSKGEVSIFPTIRINNAELRARGNTCLLFNVNTMALVDSQGQVLAKKNHVPQDIKDCAIGDMIATIDIDGLKIWQQREDTLHPIASKKIANPLMLRWGSLGDIYIVSMEQGVSLQRYIWNGRTLAKKGRSVALEETPREMVPFEGGVKLYMKDGSLHEVMLNGEVSRQDGVFHPGYLVHAHAESSQIVSTDFSSRVQIRDLNPAVCKPAELLAYLHACQAQREGYALMTCACMQRALRKPLDAVPGFSYTSIPQSCDYLDREIKRRVRQATVY